MTEREKTLVTLAAKMMLTPRQAIVLPATIEVAARKCRMDEFDLMAQLMTKTEARDYFASVCRTTAETMQLPL